MNAVAGLSLSVCVLLMQLGSAAASHQAQMAPVTIASLDIEGLESASLDEIDSWGRIEAGDAFDEERLERFVGELKLTLSDHGYFQSTIQEPVVTTSEDGVHIRIKVIEGVRFRFGAIELRSDGPLLPNAHARLDGLQRGDVATVSAIFQATSQLDMYYSSFGYSWAAVNVTPKLHAVAPGEKESIVDLVFTVETGCQFIMGSFTVDERSGMDPAEVQSFVAIREGQVYDEEKLRLGLLQLATKSGLDARAYDPDLFVSFDHQTRRADVTFRGFRKWTDRP